MLRAGKKMVLVYKFTEGGKFKKKTQSEEY